MRRHENTWLKLVALVLALVLMVPMLAACGGGEAQKTPTTTLPPDWTYYTAGKLWIGLPNSWMTIEMTAEKIDALIKQMGSSNPDLVPILEAAKQSKAIKLMALDLTFLNPMYMANFNVVYEIGLLSLDRYAAVMKDQLKSLGGDVTIGEQFFVRGYRAVKLQNSLVYQTPHGDSYQAEQQAVIVDHAADRYIIGLTYNPEDAQKYKSLFDQIVQTIDFTE